MSPAAALQGELFRGLTEEELSRLAAHCQDVQFPAGDILFREGDPGDTMYILTRGRVRIFKSLSIGVDKTLAVVGPGEIFGEISLTDGGPRSASAEVLLDSVALSVSRDDLDRVAGITGALGVKLYRRLAETVSMRLRATNDLLRDACDWGLEVSGAAALNLHEVVSGRVDIEILISGGQVLRGRILKVDQSKAGHEVTLQDGEGRLHVIPYHAVLDIVVGEGPPPLT